MVFLLAFSASSGELKYSNLTGAPIPKTSWSGSLCYANKGELVSLNRIKDLCPPKRDYSPVKRAYIKLGNFKKNILGIQNEPAKPHLVTDYVGDCTEFEFRKFKEMREKGKFTFTLEEVNDLCRPSKPRSRTGYKGDCRKWEYNFYLKHYPQTEVDNLCFGKAKSSL